MKLIFYRIYQIFIMLPLALIITVLAAVLTIIATALGGAKWWGYQIPRIWAKLFCWITLVRVKVYGRDNISKGQSYVFVANHQGAYDIFSIYGFLGHNFKWMMKKSLERIPLVGFTCKVSGHIFVDNSSPHAVKETMETAEKRLAGGMSVVVFPEGSRTIDGKLHRFKRGAYILATEFQLPVVPITIDGAYNIMPRKAILPKWGTIVLTIHKPIYPGNDGHDLATLMEESYKAIASSLPNEGK